MLTLEISQEVCSTTKSFFGTIMKYSQTNNMQKESANFIKPTKSYGDGKVSSQKILRKAK